MSEAENEHCNNCQYYEAYDSTIEVIDSYRNLGECKVKSPIAMMISDRPKSVWPEVRANNWCGEHKPKK